MIIDPHKYIVFNRKEYEIGRSPGELPGDTPQELDDAVVIRKQDRFAHVGLAAYASGVLSAAEMLEALGLGDPKVADHVRYLLALADFMAGEADEARKLAYKLPD